MCVSGLPLTQLESVSIFISPIFSLSLDVARLELPDRGLIANLLCDNILLVSGRGHGSWGVRIVGNVSGLLFY